MLPINHSSYRSCFTFFTLVMFDTSHTSHRPCFLSTMFHILHTSYQSGFTYVMTHTYNNHLQSEMTHMIYDSPSTSLFQLSCPEKVYSHQSGQETAWNESIHSYVDMNSLKDQKHFRKLFITNLSKNLPKEQCVDDKLYTACHKISTD